MHVVDKIAVDHRKNNFDILRLVAAFLVLLSHSYILYDGKTTELLGRNTGYITFSNIALATFFTISGYLITASYLSRGNLKAYSASRALRIFPALIVVVLLSTFVLGPIVTTLSISEYFSDPQSRKYLRNIMILPLQYELPGVFRDNPYVGAVNGSLWTLAIEFKCYILIAILGATRLLNKRSVFMIATIAICLFIPFHFYENPPKRFMGVKVNDILSHGEWGYFFFAGSFYYFMKDKIKYSTLVYIGLILGNIIMIKFPTSAPAFFMLSMPYIIFHTSFALKSRSHILKGNDISYGFYIYAFPVQQLYMHYIGAEYGWHVWLIATTIITAILAFLSWKLVERPFLKLKLKNI